MRASDPRLFTGGEQGRNGREDRQPRVVLGVLDILDLEQSRYFKEACEEQTQSQPDTCTEKSEKKALQEQRAIVGYLPGPERV